MSLARGVFSITARASGTRGSGCRGGLSPCFWRTDGIPLWEEPRWLADASRDYGFGVNAARKFAEESASGWVLLFTWAATTYCS